MRYSPYEFKERDAFDFASFINAQTKPPSRDELIFKSCPYCRPSGSDRSNLYSFSINLRTGQFKCLRGGCLASGNMIRLSRDFGFSLGTEIDEYYEPKRKFRNLPQRKIPYTPKPEVVSYLTGRGISEDIIEKYRISARKDNPSVIAFPFYDESDRLQYIKYRNTKFNPEKDVNKEWTEKNCKPILFGMEQCNDKFDRFILSEGMIDSLSIASAGIENAVSVPNGARGFTWVPYCWDWMLRFKEVIVFGDYEKGRITLLDDMDKRLRMKLAVKHVREEDYKDCKDANEILKKYGKEQIRRCVENAASVPIKRVMRLSDVRRVDMAKIKRSRTGISQLDRLLYGGLPLGGFSIISGKTGKGKSVLASQILVNAISQGYKCFAYSGELAAHQFQSIIDLQIAGADYVNECKNKWGDSVYNVLNSNREKISEWYKDKCWIYDNSVIEDDEKESLLNIAESVITQYGVQVILLDNLMTAIDLELSSGSDRYERQSEFVKKIAKLAQAHDVLIILVAHKRKNNFNSNENDEIMGSSDITNLAMVVMAYETDKEILESQRKLIVSKERLFGRTETKGYILDYDQKSRRIYGRGDNLHADYGWNRNAGVFVETNLENPFIGSSD